MKVLSSSCIVTGLKVRNNHFAISGFNLCQDSRTSRGEEVLMVLRSMMYAL